MEIYILLEWSILRFVLCKIISESHALSILHLHALISFCKESGHRRMMWSSLHCRLFILLIGSAWTFLILKPSWGLFFPFPSHLFYLHGEIPHKSEEKCGKTQSFYHCRLILFLLLLLILLMSWNAHKLSQISCSNTTVIFQNGKDRNIEHIHNSNYGKIRIKHVELEKCWNTSKHHTYW